MLFRFRVYGAVVVNHGGFFVFCNKTRSNISLVLKPRKDSQVASCSGFICIPGAFALLLPLDWFSFLMRFPASQMRFLSETMFDMPS